MKIFKHIQKWSKWCNEPPYVITQLEQLSTHGLSRSYLLLHTCNMFWCYVHEAIKSFIISLSKTTLWKHFYSILIFEEKTKGVVISKEQEGSFLDLFLDLSGEYTGAFTLL